MMMMKLSLLLALLLPFEGASTSSFSMETLAMQSDSIMDNTKCEGLIRSSTSHLPEGATCNCGYNMEGNSMVQCDVPTTATGAGKLTHLVNTIALFFDDESATMKYAVDCLCSNKDCQGGSLSFDDYCIFISHDDENEEPECSFLWVESQEECGTDECTVCMSQDGKYLGANVNACYEYDECLETFIAPFDTTTADEEEEKEEEDANAPAASFDEICTHLSSMLQPSYDCECLPNTGEYDVVTCRLRDDVIWYYFERSSHKPVMELDCHCAGGVCGNGSPCYMVTFEEDEVPVCSQVRMTDTLGQVEQTTCTTCTFCGTWGPGYLQVSPDASSNCRTTTTLQGCLGTKLLPYDLVLPPPPPQAQPQLPARFETACAYLQDHYEAAFEDTHCQCNEMEGASQLTVSCVVPNELGYFLNNLLWFFDPLTGDPLWSIHCHCTSVLCGSDEKDYCYTIFFDEDDDEPPSCLFQLPHSGAACPSHTFGGQCTVMDDDGDGGLYYDVMVEDCDSADAVLSTSASPLQQTLIMYPLPPA